MPGEQNPSVLIVDDSQSILALVADILRGAGWSVSRATNVPEALEEIRLRPPRLILLDLMLPGESGFDFLKTLQAGAGRGIPVVILSARRFPQEIEKARSLGAADYIIKPFETAELLAKVRRHIQGGEPGTAK